MAGVVSKTQARVSGENPPSFRGASSGAEEVEVAGVPMTEVESRERPSSGERPAHPRQGSDDPIL